MFPARFHSSDEMGTERPCESLSSSSLYADSIYAFDNRQDSAACTVIPLHSTTTHYHTRQSLHMADTVIAHTDGPCDCRKSGRNLVVCIDGTSNQFNERVRNYVINIFLSSLSSVEYKRRRAIQPPSERPQSTDIL